ncbi:hypothetical protein NDU88_000547 [Pleurodeles waltl]|uniref:Uncharacterized protein n=1 Tax=Pleurodeles waltl TaxID=8319 RepID=A0AAV7R4J6_PLEWA|nr:hypothetical protein NDU88_000547 [Pleurodeles waltl]
MWPDCCSPLGHMETVVCARLVGPTGASPGAPTSSASHFSQSKKGSRKHWQGEKSGLRRNLQEGDTEPGSVGPLKKEPWGGIKAQYLGIHEMKRQEEQNTERKSHEMESRPSTSVFMR